MANGDLQKEINTKKNAEIGEEIRLASRTNLFQRLAARFGFGIQKPDKKTKSSFKIIQKPTKDQLTAKDTTQEINLIDQLFRSSKMSSTIQDLYEEWVQDTQNTYRNVQEREERLNALTYLCDNEGIVMQAVQLVASEVAALTDNWAFTVTSEDENWQARTNLLLRNVWHFNQPVIYGIAWNLFLYGEAFQAAEWSSAGCTNVFNLKVNEIVERMEFKPSEISNFNAQVKGGSGAQSTGFTVNIMRPTNGSFGQNNLNFNPNVSRVSYKSTDELLKNYIQNLTDVSSTEFFTTHLMGYRLPNDEMVAPWQVIHYRYQADTSEFWPYGRPMLLSALSAWKQMQRVMGLDDLATLLNMPIHMFKVKTNGANTTRAFDIVNDVKEDFENVGLMSSAAGMEGPSLCTNIWTSDDLLTVEKVGGDGTTDNSNTDKMKFFYERLAAATGIPMSYLNPTAEGFQMSGVALSALFKPFRTLVENLRAIIISEVENLIRLHDSVCNEVTPDFVLTMNVENPVATDDLSSKLQLADSVLEAVAGLLGVEDKGQLPQSIKRDVLSRYGCLSIQELENYISVQEREGPSEPGEMSDTEMDASFGDSSADEDYGSDDTDMGSDDEGSVEESYRKKGQRLLETRYRASTHDNIMQYYLTEQLGTLKLRRSTNHFCSQCNSKDVELMTEFLEKSHMRRHGKQRIQG